MKGLLLKDFYLITKYCRAFFILIIAFGIISAFTSDNIFLFYPCVIASMLPMTLQSYDEREKWCTYSAALPYSKAKQVSAKYIIGLLASVISIIIITAAQLYKLCTGSVYSANDLIFLILQLFAISLLPPAFTLPFIFKFGTEKGRILYYVVIGASCALITINSESFDLSELSQAAASNGNSYLMLFFVASVILYVVSWILSVKFYKKREF